MRRRGAATPRVALPVTLGLLLGLAAAGCAKKEAAPPPGPAVPPMSPAELARNTDACQAYVQQVCACAARVPALAHECDLARALPDAVKISAQVAASPDSKPKDIVSAQASIRLTAKNCIQKTAALPQQGC